VSAPARRGQKLRDIAAEGDERRFAALCGDLDEGQLCRLRHYVAGRWERLVGRGLRKLSVAAVHEAGHAVVSCAYGWKLRSAGISSNQAGAVLWPRSYAERQSLEQRLDVILAGPVAETVYYPLGGDDIGNYVAYVWGVFRGAWGLVWEDADWVARDAVLLALRARREGGGAAPPDDVSDGEFVRQVIGSCGRVLATLTTHFDAWVGIAYELQAHKGRRVRGQAVMDLFASCPPRPELADGPGRPPGAGNNAPASPPAAE
jgi:hypothetical protein